MSSWRCRDLANSSPCFDSKVLWKMRPADCKMRCRILSERPSREFLAKGVCLVAEGIRSVSESMLVRVTLIRILD